MDEVVITGGGVVSPYGFGYEPFIDGLHSGSVAIGDNPWVPQTDEYFTWYAPVPDIDLSDRLDPKIIDGTDRFARWTLISVPEALQRAGLPNPPVMRTAVVIGTSGGGTNSLQRAQHLASTQGPQAVPRKLLIQIWPNMAASQVSMALGLHGPQLTVTSACASSIDAIGLAARLIESGQVDVAIAGGSEGGNGTNDDFVPATFYAQRAYGMTTFVPGRLEASLPMDVRRSGVVTGEGAGIVILERKAHAEARHARILGRVRGWGTVADGYHPSAPEPSGKWEAEAMNQALLDARCQPADIDAILAHATGTPKGDGAEIAAINLLHHERATPLHVTSIKGHIGHTGAASGVMAVLVCLDTFANKRLPHTAGTVNPDPAVEFDLVMHKPIALDPKRCQINGFGFGGQNASIVIEAPEEPDQAA
jgi:3-oxoacyl-[acyl-carrier-protein] synthase II